MTSSASENDEDTLFPRASPHVFRAVFPWRWLGRFLARRYSLFRAFGKTWNDPEPIAMLLSDGIIYGEGPRFCIKDNALYFSDMYAKQVLKYDLSSKRTVVVYEADDYVSGLGWLPDGRLLVVLMDTRRIVSVSLETSLVSEYANVSHVTRVRANDMVVDLAGRAYVGNFGFIELSDFRRTTLVRVDPDQSVHVDADGLFLPNGSVITPDGKTLIIAETLEGVLTAFDIEQNGSLSNRRVWADLGVPCDGITLDAEGCIWAAVPQVGIHKTAGALVRVKEGGDIVGLFGFGLNGIRNSVFACQLGTDSTTGKHFLFFLEARESEERAVLRKGLEAAKQNGVLKAIEVPVGPARMNGNDRYCGGYC